MALGRNLGLRLLSWFPPLKTLLLKRRWAGNNPLFITGIATRKGCTHVKFTSPMTSPLWVAAWWGLATAIGLAQANLNVVVIDAGHTDAVVGEPFAGERHQ